MTTVSNASTADAAQGSLYAKVEAAEGFGRRLLVAHGLSEEDAATMTGCLVRADHGRDALDHQVRLRIDQPAPQPVEILRQELQAVGVDAAQVGAHQATGHGGGVFFG